jgi:hypothetical protein
MGAILRREGLYSSLITEWRRARDAGAGIRSAPREHSSLAFTPSFAFNLLGAHRFDQIRGDRRARGFLSGAGPAAIGAIFCSPARSPAR